MVMGHSILPLTLRKENIMFNSFAEFFKAVKTAEFDFAAIRDYIVSVYYEMTVNPDISEIWNGIMSLIAPIFKFVMIAVVVGCLLIAFFGKKIKGFLTFVGFFVLGFTAGIYFLTPIIPETVTIPGWLVGLVVAIVAAVIHRFLYYFVYALAVGYSVYIITFNGFYISSIASYTMGKALVCLFVSLICVIIAFAVRKYIEMVGTAALGAYLATVVFIKNIYDFSALPIFASAPWVAILIPTAVIGILGAIVQIKTRRRY